MIEEALVAYLNTNVTGCTFEWVDADADTQPPFAVIRSEGEDPIRTQQGTSPLVSVDVAIDVFAKTAVEAVGFERQIKALLQDYRGPMAVPEDNPITIDSVDIRGRFSGREAATKLIYTTINFEIWFR